MPETPPPALIEELLAALVEAENAETVELPEPASAVPFPTVL